MGEPLSQPTYGYTKSPENKKKLIIDQEAASIVKSYTRIMLSEKSVMSGLLSYLINTKKSVWT